MAGTVILPGPLQRIVQETFSAAGCNPTEAQQIAERLVDSNLVGHDSHGVIRVSYYVNWLKEGLVRANQTLKIISENEVLAIVDGNSGFGQSIGVQAVRLGLEKVRHLGVSVIGVRNCGHLGRIGDWPRLAADQGILSLHFVNTSGLGNLVPPFGGIDRRLSANPIAVGIPVAGRVPMIVDISCSSIAEGKIKVAFNKGVPVPENCIIDSEGKPTTDPKVFYANPPGAILPFGGHKGYCLSVVAEVLAGAITGGGCTAPGIKSLSNGMLSIYLDPGRFALESAYGMELNRFIDWIKSSRTATPGGEILVPGEIEERTKAARTRNGIELDDTTWQQIQQTAQAVGITPQRIQQILASP